MDKKKGIYIGRFSPFHNGHLESIKNILTQVDEVIIVVGSAQLCYQIQNPFTAGERITMIKLALEEEKIDKSRYMIVPVPDVDAHHKWVSQIITYVPRFDVVYSNGPLVKYLFKQRGIRVNEIPFFKRASLSATNVRNKILKKEDWITLVPKNVYKFIEEIDGVNRIRELNKTDDE